MSAIYLYVLLIYYVYAWKQNASVVLKGGIKLYHVHAAAGSDKELERAL